MKINAKELQKAISTLAPLTTRRTGNLLTNCFCAVLAEDGIKLVATNGEEYSSSWVTSKGVISPMADVVCIPALPFVSAIQNAQQEEISITFKDNTLILKSGGTTTIKTQSAERFPKEPEDKFTEIGCETADLAYTLGRLSKFPACQPSENRPMLENIQCTLNGKMECTVMDGRIFATCVKQTISGDAQVLIPDRQADRIRDALDQEGARFKVGEKHILVEHDQGASYFRLMEVPKWPKLPPIKELGEPIGQIDIDSFKEHISIASQMATGDGDVLLECSSSGLTVKSFLQGSGSDYEAPLKGKFKDFKGRFDPKYLKAVSESFTKTVSVYRLDNQIPSLQFSDGELFVCVGGRVL